MLIRSLVLILILVSLVFCDDGMWMPHQMKMLDLQKEGLKMNPEDMYRSDGTGLMSAIVNLGGGTGEFISTNGLILTNHHVAFGALQRAATAEKNYIKDGFLAENLTQEIPASGYYADVLIKYEEITDKVWAVVKPGMSFREKYDALDLQTKKIIAEAEKAGDDVRCSIASMYSGNQYFLYTFKRLKDVRIVYAPPRDLGNFGGDTDNWMWPRHTCDFTFLRAYVSKDNRGVAFSPENVPYKPRSVLKLALDGVKEGDFTFVMGYPGKTYRNNTLSEMLFAMELMQESIIVREDGIAFYEKAGANDESIEIKYARKIKGLNNGLKNYRGKLEGFANIGLTDIKQKQEDDYISWSNSSENRKLKYGGILKKYDAYHKKYASAYRKKQEMLRLISSYYGSTMLAQAHTIVRAVNERQKPDLEREKRYQERNLERRRLAIKLAEKGYDFETDKKFLQHKIKQMFEYDADRVPAALRDLVAEKSEKEVEAWVEDIFSRTGLTGVEKRLALFDSSPSELLAENDPLIKLAMDIEEELVELREADKALNQEKLELKKVYLEGLQEINKGRLAPDANSTLRFTFGTVQGYNPRDAVRYTPITTLGGVIAKDRGAKPFNVPEKIKELHKKRDFGIFMDQNLNDVPACFLNTTNVTGGNSGSPTINARGDQVGIIFDMTYESVTGDYYVIPELQRTISVDIRYVLFVTEKFAGARYLLEEMGIYPAEQIGKK